MDLPDNFLKSDLASDARNTILGEECLFTVRCTATKPMNAFIKVSSSALRAQRYLLSFCTAGAQDPGCNDPARRPLALLGAYFEKEPKRVGMNARLGRI